MSTIITQTSGGRMKMVVLAPHSRTIVLNVDLDDWIIEIEGVAEVPFILSGMFKRCTIIADDMSAFDKCLFQESCEMVIGSDDLGNNIEVRV